MQCPTCQSEARKFGKDRYGNQRYQCEACARRSATGPRSRLTRCDDKSLSEFADAILEIQKAKKFGIEFAIPIADQKSTQ